MRIQTDGITLRHPECESLEMFANFPTTSVEKSLIPWHITDGPRDPLSWRVLTLISWFPWSGSTGLGRVSRWQGVVRIDLCSEGLSWGILQNRWGVSSGTASIFPETIHTSFWIENFTVNKNSQHTHCPISSHPVSQEHMWCLLNHL